MTDVTKTAAKVTKTSKTAGVKKTAVVKKTKTMAAAKTATKSTATVKVRPPAKELMAARKRVTFGASFINAVLGGVHRDVAKMVLLGKELGAGTKSELAKLKLETLRERVAAAILKAEQLPASATY